MNIEKFFDADEPAMTRKFHAEGRKYYVSVGTSCYLHRDGILRIGAVHNGVDSGWYATRANAQKAIQLYKKVTKSRGDQW